MIIADKGNIIPFYHLKADIETLRCENCLFLPIEIGYQQQPF